MEEITIQQALSQALGMELFMALKTSSRSITKNARGRIILNNWERPSLRRFIRKNKKICDLLRINLVFIMVITCSVFGSIGKSQ